MHPSRKRTGFTLIELLTVIAIIAILMGLLLPALNAAKNAARKSQAKNDLTQLVAAVKAFYTDYGVYPIDPQIEQGTPKDVEYGTSGETHNQDVINVLRADTNTADSLATSGSSPLSVNTREVVYLDVPLVKDNTSPKAGLSSAATQGPYQNGKAGDWYDPFGEPYIVAIDGNYDGYVQNSSAALLNYNDLNYITTYQGTNNGGGNAVQSGCIAGSFGADRSQGAHGNKNFQNSDDVLSWQ
jgi:prepilin-type N-terminal cleavage/methylation domain-containing protein